MVEMFESLNFLNRPGQGVDHLNGLSLVYRIHDFRGVRQGKVMTGIKRLNVVPVLIRFGRLLPVDYADTEKMLQFVIDG